MKEQLEKTLESKEKPTSRIILEIFRHEEREKKEGMPDEESRLTPKGRQRGIEKGKKIHPQPDVALAIGSPRKRAQEMAARVMLAEEEKMTPEMSLEKIERFISSKLKCGKKIVTDPRLNFFNIGETGKRRQKAFSEKRMMQYMIHESDRDAVKFKDEQTIVYSRAAGNVAEIIKKYVEIAPNFDKLVKQKPKEYKKYNNQMERYLGSHQSIPESFLIKALEKIKGLKYKNEFVESLGAGFKKGEGFRVEINNTSQGVELEIKYKLGEKEENVEVSPEILEEIIKERDELEKKIKES